MARKDESGRGGSGKIGILGVGNPLRGDDGAGVAVAELLQKEKLPGVTVLDVGIDSMGLLHALAEFDEAIIIDAVDFGGRPGEVKSFGPDDIKSVRKGSGMSTHKCDVFGAIEMSKGLGECPKKITIFAIQPATFGPRTGLSPRVKTAVAKVAKEIIKLTQK